MYVHSTVGTLINPSSENDWRQVPSELICRNMASPLLERGFQFPISTSTFVTSVRGVWVGGISVGGTGVGVAVGGMGVGVAAGAPHPTSRSVINIVIIPC